jgi:hypothetical protein
MSDEIDMAQDHIEREEDMRRKYRKPAALEVDPTGSCLNCGEFLTGKERWCDQYCREDWQKRRNK